MQNFIKYNGHSYYFGFLPEKEVRKWPDSRRAEYYYQMSVWLLDEDRETLERLFDDANKEWVAKEYPYRLFRSSDLQPEEYYGRYATEKEMKESAKVLKHWGWKVKEVVID